ncbi:hypothetical protein FHL15_001280 [Xylaria flabelliformis]|uniref:2EXR domain-containing protein n=1 Tax=Xylaria flabelliformis TaxID=2512241 RepID=A0A553ICZ7_9PEZI|nr:hypothetical protein FHL15_001280 [Xylaria flabelliformis]
MTATFPLFPKLPPELRNTIWHAALPHSMRPGLFPYRAGCWCPRWLLPSEAGYDPINAENNLAFEVRYSLLNKARVHVPMAFVNTDARGIAIAWTREQSSQVCYSSEGDHRGFFRSFDPDLDVVYVAPHQWDRFLSEPLNRQFESDLVGKFVDVRSGFERIGVSEALLRDAEHSLSELFDWYFGLQTLYIIMDAPSDLDLDSMENDTIQGLIWELDRSQRVASWTGSDWEFYHTFDDGQGDSRLRESIELASSGLREGLLGMNIKTFEIHITIAVRN